MSSWPMLVLVIAILAECGREAWLDRSPKLLAHAPKPRPIGTWWSARHSPTDYVKHTVRMRHRRWAAPTRSGGK